MTRLGHPNAEIGLSLCAFQDPTVTGFPCSLGAVNVSEAGLPSGVS